MSIAKAAQAAAAKSPIDEFVATITVMGRNKHLIAGLRTMFSDWDTNAWHEIIEDLGVLTQGEGRPTLRSSWARMVAAPIVAAQRLIREKAKRFTIEVTLLGCQDARLRDICLAYVERYDTNGDL